MRVRRVGVFGGTFDPIHIGHLASASEVMGVFELDEVVFVPTGVSGHKPGRDIVDCEHRFNMVQLATGSNPRFTVSRVDIDRPGVTYTVDTLAALHDSLGDGVELFFVVGDDAAADVANWRDVDRLFTLATFVSVNRNQVTCPPADGRIVSCTLPELRISSTEIRRRVAADEPVWYWLPDPVLTYIGKHSLYGADWARRA